MLSRLNVKYQKNRTMTTIFTPNSIENTLLKYIVYVTFPIHIRHPLKIHKKPHILYTWRIREDEFIYGISVYTLHTFYFSTAFSLLHGFSSSSIFFFIVFLLIFMACRSSITYLHSILYLQTARALQKSVCVGFLSKDENNDKTI